MHEALAIVARKVTASGQIQHRLLALTLVQQALKGRTYAQLVIKAVSRISLPFDDILFLSRDRAASNTTAVQTLQQSVFLNSLDLPCLSHALDLVGENLAFQKAHSFLGFFNSAISTSAAAVALWVSATGSAPKRHSKTRWWSTFEQCEDLALQFPVIEKWVDRLSDEGTFARVGAPVAGHVALRVCALLFSVRLLLLAGVAMASAAGLKRLLVGHRDLIAAELAITCDAMRSFVQLTYEFEGNGFLAPVVFSKLEVRHRFAVRFTVPPHLCGYSVMFAGAAQVLRGLLSSHRRRRR